MGTSEPGSALPGEHNRLRAEPEPYALRDRRFIGSMITRPAHEPRRGLAWELGASGERIVGAHLDRIAGIEVLHDRRIPGTRASIDHIAVGPGGVYVIDAKLYGGRLGQHTAAQVLQRDARLAGASRDQTKLFAKLGVAVNVIARALGTMPIPVRPALCFVDAQGTTRAEPFMLDGVWVGTPAALPDLVARPGLLDLDARQSAAGLLDERLPRT